jgi:type IV secretion system protein TrbL
MNPGDASFTGLLDQYQGAINAAYGNLAGDINWLLWAMITFNVVLAGFQWMFSEDNVAPQLVRKLLFLGFFVWLVNNWAMLTNTLMTTMMMLGMKAANTPVTTQAPSPEHILGYGYYSFFELLNQMNKLAEGLTGALTNFPTILILAIAGVVILAAFLVIAIQMAVALLFFKLGSLAVLILLPFGMLNHTAFIAERPLGWVIASGVRVMILTLVCSIGFNLFGAMQITPQNVSIPLAINVAIQSVLLMVISVCATRLAGDLMSGGPTLGAGNVAGAAAGAAVAGAAVAKVTAEAGGTTAVKSIRAASAVVGKAAEYDRAAGRGTAGQQVKNDVQQVVTLVKQAAATIAGKGSSPWQGAALASAGRGSRASGSAASRPARTFSVSGSAVYLNTPGLAAMRDNAGRAAAQLGQSGGGGGGLNARLGDAN